MTAKEIIRRLRALIAMADKDRPIALDTIERIAGLGKDCAYGIATQESMHEPTRIRLAQAFRWIENDQLVIKRKVNKRSEITIRPPQPPQTLVPVVQIGGSGPSIRFLAQNPRAFPQRVDSSTGKGASSRAWQDSRKNIVAGPTGFSRLRSRGAPTDAQ